MQLIEIDLLILHQGIAVLEVCVTVRRDFTSVPTRTIPASQVSSIK